MRAAERESLVMFNLFDRSCANTLWVGLHTDERFQVESSHDKIQALVSDFIFDKLG